MNTTKGMHQLSEMFKTKDWFHDVGTDQYGRLVVYIKYSCEETIRNIPDTVEGIQVLVHFASSKDIRKEDFVTSANTVALAQVTKPEVNKDLLDLGSRIQALYVPDEELPLDFVTGDINELTKELDHLEKMCGSNALQDVFYEIHDGKNSVTNLSARYPEVRKSLEQLYDEYGFDVIYEELDG